MYWTRMYYKRFNLISCPVKFLESDKTPISYALLSFSLIFKSLDQFDLRIGVMYGDKKA